MRVEPIKNFFAKTYLLFLMKNEKKNQFTFNGFYKNSESVLIIFPENESVINEALEVLPSFTEKKSDLTLLIKEEIANKIADIKNFNVITYTPKDESYLKLPNFSVKNKLRHKNYNLVVDLNLKPDYFAINCIKTVKSEWKLGFYNKFTEKIFNIQIKNSSIEPKISYKNLLNCLTMF